MALDSFKNLAHTLVMTAPSPPVRGLENVVAFQRMSDLPSLYPAPDHVRLTVKRVAA